MILFFSKRRKLEGGEFLYFESDYILVYIYCYLNKDLK